MAIRIPQRQLEAVSPGEYEATITAVEPAEGQYGPQLKFTFVLVDDGRKLSAWCPQVFHPRSKLYGWVKAALFRGGDIPAEYDFDSDDMLGQPVRVEVVTGYKADGTDYAKVAGVLLSESALDDGPRF